MGTGFPLDFQFFSTLHCRPGAIGNYGHATQCLKHVWWFEIGDDHNICNACHFAGFTIIVTLILATIDRGAFNGREHHAGDFRIHTERTFAGDQIVKVNHRNIFADVAVFTFLLEGQFFNFWYRLLCGQSHQGTVSKLLAAGVNHFMIAGMTFGSGHFPLFGSGSFQHQFCAGTGLTNGIVEIANGTGTIGVL